MPEEAAIGVDPWCVSVDTAQRWERSFAKKQQKLVQTAKNLVDEVWKSRPLAETNAVIIHPLEFSGRSVADKLKDLRERLIKEKARGIIITGLDEVSLFPSLSDIFITCVLLRLKFLPQFEPLIR